MMQRNDRLRLLELLDAAKKEVSAAKVEIVHCKSNRINDRRLLDGEHYTFSNKKVINPKV